MTAPTTLSVQVTGSSTVPCAPDQKLLDAFLRNGVYLPNSCNQGTCGTCKVRVTEGRVAGPTPSETVLSPAEQADGFVLACQSTPQTDAVIEVPSSETTGPRHALRDFAGTVHAIREVARDTVAVLVDVDEPIEFSAGQYIEVAVPGTDTMRQYSMANPPSAPDRLEFHVRRVAGGMATEGWIFDSLRPGHEVQMRGPWGDFVHDRTDTEAPIVMLAGGTGLAPMKAIARDALAHDPAREIHVYHGVQRRADLYDLDFWEGLAAEHTGVRFVPCLSREEWDGRTGYVGDAMLDDFPALRGYLAYLCGPPAMVEAGVKACKRRRMSARNIRREKF